MTEKVACIDAYRAEFGVEPSCRALLAVIRASSLTISSSNDPRFSGIGNPDQVCVNLWL